MKNLVNITITLFCTIFMILGFVMPLNPAGNWYQQFLPALPNMQVSDMHFLDSTTGFIVTGNGSPNDSSGYILKTSNGGDNWVLKFGEYRDFSRVKFINQNTGFVSGGYFNGARLYKTTNAGDNWFNIYNVAQIYLSDMHILNEDTIWVVNPNNLEGGVFRTTNGGVNWTQQASLGNNNPEDIYMFNARIGFFSGLGNSELRKTTNSGVNWTLVSGADGFCGFTNWL
jgi:photosystem II stability/assembly factor-like uncharacterized protein